VKINVKDEFRRLGKVEMLLLTLLGPEAEIAIALVDDVLALASRGSMSLVT
jgi:hypothetical protein